jgi:hypothetical protein
VNPASQTHLEGSVWAVSPCVPELGPHSVQGDEPFSDLKVSAKHAVGVLPFAPVYPLFAAQAVTAAEPVKAPVAELDGQPLQSASPVEALKVSAKHAVGVLPFAPVYPLFAAQAVTAAEPVTAPVAELDGQPLQSASPVEALKVSAGQGLQLL